MNRQQRRAQRAERERLLAIAAEAGIDPSEIIDHPEHGLCVSQAGLRKLVAIAPNPDPGKYLLEWAAQWRRRQMRAVDDTEQ